MCDGPPFAAPPSKSYLNLVTAFLTFMLWFLLGFLQATAVHADEAAGFSTDAENWRLRQNEDGIRIYVRDVPGTDFHAYRAEMTIEARLNTLAAVLDDVENADEWIHYTEKGILIERIDEQTAVVSLLTDLPWPAGDRDSVTINRLTQDSDTGVVRYTYSARPDAVSERDGYIRVDTLEGLWELTPTDEGTVEIEYYTLSDPGGSVPAWVINLVITQQPFNTLQNLREIVREPRYRNADVTGIEDGW